MAKGYSLIKRGNFYYCYHRFTPEGILKGVSLKTNEQREANRRAKEVVQEANRKLLVSVEPSEEIKAEAKREYDEMRKSLAKAKTDEERAAALKPLMDAAKASVDYYYRQRDEEAREREDEQRRQREKQETLRRKQEEERLQAELDANDPRADTFWRLGETKADDTGLFVDWCKDGNRSPNTLIAYRTAWSRFRQYYDIQRLGDIKLEMAKEFPRKCRCDTTRSGRRGPLGAPGANQYVICMQGMISTAIKEGWFKGENPFQMKYQHKRDNVVNYLSEEEVKKLLEEAKKLDLTTYLFLAIAVHTGLRKDEVANLLWTDVDFEQKVVTVQAKKENRTRGIQAFQVKSKQARAVPLKKELAKILKKHRVDEGYIIQSRSGKEMKRSRWNLPNQFWTAQENAGVKCNPHLLRHTFASHAAIQGVSIFKISKWLGHSTVELTANTYAHLQAHDEDIDRF